MKRRMFTFGLAALAAAPALPLAANAIPAAPSAAAVSRFATAKLIARSHNACSPAMLQRLLRVDAPVAAELNAMLLNRGVITAAGADGMSMALNPMNTNCVPSQALKPTNLGQSVAQVRKKVAEVKERYHEWVAEDETDDRDAEAPAKDPTARPKATPESSG